MDYKLGEQYEMRVVGIRVDSNGFKYIALHDDDPSKEYRVYNILKCQYESLPETLYVKVKSIDSFGKIRFLQDEGRLNQEHYHVGNLYSFEVKDIREDTNSTAQYYLIEDDFTSHRYYFTGEKRYKVGEDCVLEIEGFTDKGFLMLKEMEHHLEEAPVEHAIEPASDDDEPLRKNWESFPTLDKGEESEVLEYKTSIVFPPKSKGVANIDKQIKNILTALVAFMNTDGGDLYIGIHDRTKKIIGIEDDFEHLNESDRDEYEYQKNIDGYQLKIRNSMEALCTGAAGSLVHFSFPVVKGNTYCHIKVDKAIRPVYLDGSKLFVRQGNRNKQLKDDEITMYVYERMSLSIGTIIDIDDMPANEGLSENIGKLNELMIELINTRNSALIPKESLPKKKLGDIDLWIVWYNDGTWRRQRDKSEETNVYLQIPIYKELKDGLLVFCYGNGKVNVMNLKDFQSKVRMNKLESRRPGWYRNGDKPVNIFLMHPTDFLVGYCVDSDGIQHVKLHYISDYTIRKSADNAGSSFVPQDRKVLKYATIGAEHKNKVEHLIVKKSERSNNPGPALTSPNIKNEIDYLKKVLEQE